MRLLEASEFVQAERGQALAMDFGEIVADHQRQIERLGDRLDPADEIDRRSDDGEIESIRGSDIAVDDRAIVAP